MSWILNPDGDGGGKRKRPAKPPTASEGDAPTAPQAEGAEAPPEEPVKAANKPFLAYAQYREQRKKEHDAWLKRKEEREEKLARGEEVGPEEPDPTEEPEVGCLGLLKFIVISLVVIILAGKFFTGSFLWEQELPDLSKLVPRNQRLFSERMLSQFSGDVEGKPIYLAIDGDVYDVSSNARIYGPGGSYHFMAGRDAARAFATGCFQTHLTHDIRGLTDSEYRGLQHWKKFFADSKKYRQVGRVLHEPIDPMSPVPEPCDPKKAAKQIDHPPVKDDAKQEAKHHEEL